MADPTRRRSLDETWAFLRADGLEMPYGEDGRPHVPPSMPSQGDDEPLGFSFFRGKWVEVDFSNLTLPRTFFGRSSFERVSFANTNLSESRVCWNDFDDCDFSGADLSGSDLRASIYKGCKF